MMILQHCSPTLCGGPVNCHLNRLNFTGTSQGVVDLPLVKNVSTLANYCLPGSFFWVCLPLMIGKPFVAIDAVHCKHAAATVVAADTLVLVVFVAATTAAATSLALLTMQAPAWLSVCSCVVGLAAGAGQAACSSSGGLGCTALHAPSVGGRCCCCCCCC